MAILGRHSDRLLFSYLHLGLYGVGCGWVHDVGLGGACGMGILVRGKERMAERGHAISDEVGVIGGDWVGLEKWM